MDETLLATSGCTRSPSRPAVPATTCDECLGLCTEIITEELGAPPAT